MYLYQIEPQAPLLVVTLSQKKDLSLPSYFPQQHFEYNHLIDTIVLYNDMQNLQILVDNQEFSINHMAEKLILGSFWAIFHLFDALDSTIYPMLRCINVAAYPFELYMTIHWHKRLPVTKNLTFCA